MTDSGLTTRTDTVSEVSKPPSPTTAEFFRAIADHIDKHEIKNEVSIGFTIASYGIRGIVHEQDGTSAIAELRPWAASFGATTASLSRANRAWHIGVTSTILGRSLNVAVITEAAETAALDKVTEKYTESLRKFPIRLLDACERPIPRDHIPSADCWCDPTFDQDGQFFKHPTYDGLPAKFEPPIVPGAEQDADGYAREDHR